MKLTLACLFLIWSVQAEVGNTLKCWQCTTNRKIDPSPLCDFGNTTLLTDRGCNLKRGDDYCFKLETGKKIGIFVCLSL